MSQQCARRAEDVVRTYIDVLYNQRRLDLIPELISDPTVRHKPGLVETLTMEQSMKRLHDLLDLCPELRFTMPVIVSEGGKTVIAWNGWSRQRNGKSCELAGIEIFRVAGGKIVEIWNSKEAAGLWQPTPST